MKLDMSKAYDRVEWNFLERVILKMGFCTRWVELVMGCVKTVSYSVLVNGNPTNSFKPKRGLRQGDPLSPYLFLLCANVFSALLTRAALDGHIHGVKVARTTPSVTHLFFADDSILFFQATRREVDEIKRIIQLYEGASGQRINLEKTEISASANVGELLFADLGDILGVQRVEAHKNYLGLPTIIGRSKKRVFSLILDRVQNKLKCWKEKTLSKAGKEILLKAVIQSIPTYTMSCFLLPMELCRNIERLMARFFWGSKEGERKHHWIS